MRPPLSARLAWSLSKLWPFGRRRVSIAADGCTITWRGNQPFNVTTSGTFMTAPSVVVNQAPFTVRDSKDLLLDRIAKSIDDPDLSDSEFREWLRWDASHVMYQGPSGPTSYVRPECPPGDPQESRSLLDDFLA